MLAMSVMTSALWQKETDAASTRRYGNAADLHAVINPKVQACCSPNTAAEQEDSQQAWRDLIIGVRLSQDGCNRAVVLAARERHRPGRVIQQDLQAAHEGCPGLLAPPQSMLCAAEDLQTARMRQQGGRQCSASLRSMPRRHRWPALQVAHATGEGRQASQMNMKTCHDLSRP